MIASRRSFHLALRLESSRGGAGHRARRYSPCGGHQRPCHSGGRFSANARRPSAASSDSSSSSSSVRGQRRAASSSSVERGRADDRAAGAHRERRRRGDRARRRRIAVSSASPGSTSRLTSPSWYARAASIGSPVRIASIAGARPIARGSRNSPPAAAIRLRRTSASPNADRVRGDDDVGGEHDLHAARGREPVDRDHDRLRRARGTRTRRTRRARCRASPRCPSRG